MAVGSGRLLFRFLLGVLFTRMILSVWLTRSHIVAMIASQFGTSISFSLLCLTYDIAR